LWPGYGENSRVLKWIFDRVDGKGSATKTSIGYLPAPTDIDTAGLDIAINDLEEILSVDEKGWKEALPQIRDHFAQFGSKLPTQLVKSLEELESSLS
jgi:phosphoenolpyruvate carboxykinase (GTP)